MGLDGWLLVILIGLGTVGVGGFIAVAGALLVVGRRWRHQLDGWAHRTLLAGAVACGLAAAGVGVGVAWFIHYAWHG